ncbi:hypothetical protein [Pseudescherichia sp.]|uniref:hypothetical protein n=1 Tax=Pseudescherichia sp. TaxID=2055881 RepID=UPI0028981516|nr:hypothetical protein [Pseudescherichia sp.]
MKYQHVSDLFCYLIFTLSIICLSASASAAIVRTDLVFYDLATVSQRSYTLHMLPNANGARVMLHRKDNQFSLSTLVATCINRQSTTHAQGYLWLNETALQHADPALLPILNFTQDNRLRVAIKPLENAQSVLLDRDSLTVMIVDPAMMTLGTAGCQR